jgi:hypothetical protein
MRSLRFAVAGEVTSPTGPLARGDVRWRAVPRKAHCYLPRLCQSPSPLAGEGRGGGLARARNHVPEVA